MLFWSLSLRLFGGLRPRREKSFSVKITTQDVRRANEALMRGEGEKSRGVYQRLGITPPTREEIERAGQNAMREMREMRERGEL